MNKNYTEQFDHKPFMRLSEVLKVIPVSRATWFTWVKDGTAPQPEKLGPKTTVWRTKDIKSYLDKHLNDED